MSNNILDIDKIKPLDDLPVKEDKFKGKSHKKVADALVNLIKKTDGGYAIGLEGSWGSGKSSVVKMVEDKFDSNSKNDKYLFYIFDAWAHQGDPIRRSFLECLFGFLEERGVVSIRKWSKRLRQIRAQQKRITSETIPKIPGFNYVMVIYGLTLPFLIIWANDYYDSENLKTLLWPASLIVGIPLIIAGWTKIYRINFGKSEYKKLPILPSTRYLSHKSKTEQYVFTEDTTTIEFNKYFDDLIRDVKKLDKKLVIVVDNLDRLSSESTKSLWGTMRNFFTSENWSDRSTLLKEIFLIVPYDRPYIESVFSENQITIDEDLNGNRSKSGFIDKTFKNYISGF